MNIITYDIEISVLSNPLHHTSLLLLPQGPRIAARGQNAHSKKPPANRCGGDCRLHTGSKGFIACTPLGNNLVDNPVRDRFLRIHEAIAIRILLNPLDRLAGMLR